MELPSRKPTRLKNFDYSTANYYFVTICTHNKSHLFCDVNELNICGEIAKTELLNVSNHFDGVRIDKYVIMPDHIHTIIVIGCGDKSQPLKPLPTLSTIVGLYKSGVSKRIHKIEPDVTIWQKSFNDRIIRSEQDYLKAWKYIDENPLKQAL
ncbi:MAG: transposase [Oscillospiraceae bacterium]